MPEACESMMNAENQPVRAVQRVCFALSCHSMNQCCLGISHVELAILEIIDRVLFVIYELKQC